MKTSRREFLRNSVLGTAAVGGALLLSLSPPSLPSPHFPPPNTLTHSRTPHLTHH